MKNAAQRKKLIGVVLAFSLYLSVSLSHLPKNLAMFQLKESNKSNEKSITNGGRKMRKTGGGAKLSISWSVFCTRQLQCQMQRKLLTESQGNLLSKINF